MQKGSVEVTTRRKIKLKGFILTDGVQTVNIICNSHLKVIDKTTAAKYSMGQANPVYPVSRGVITSLRHTTND